ncbi:TPA: DUF1015 domain-containing protein [Candidatus Woesearchaeota archaeon]|nr:DUF1015 domain-containing protein [Candidatus Woesearchaeota archaeon]
MAKIIGLKGLRPRDNDAVTKLTVPPYDVIRKGSRLEELLQQRQDSLWHVTLGENPRSALERLAREGILVEDNEPCAYIYVQEYVDLWGNTQQRIGILDSPEVTPYEAGQVIRHEQTFDDKVKGRLELTKQLGLTLEPVFLLTKAKITDLLREYIEGSVPSYEFVSDFQGESELHNMTTKVYRIPHNSPFMEVVKHFIAEQPLYIADGHHRYHAALLNEQRNCLAYIVEAAEIERTEGIQAYNRVINGMVPFADALDAIARIQGIRVKEAPALDGPVTLQKREFCVYSGGKVYIIDTTGLPATDDVVERLDCKTLERVIYPVLGLDDSMLADPRHFDYYPQQDNQRMKELVDSDRYNLAVALHQVSVDEVIAVADAGLADLRCRGQEALTVPRFIMPRKSTFFAPKILSGLFVLRHEMRYAA